MIEKQSTHKLIKISNGIIPLLGCFSILLLMPVTAFGNTSPFTQTPSISDITITSPGFDQLLNTASFNVVGTFKSPSVTPTVTLYIDGSSYGTSLSVGTTANETVGTWSTSISVANGWHQLKATISDSNGALSTSSQVLVNDGTTILAQIKYKQINIEYTPACVALLRSGDMTSCPPLEKLIPFDNSSQKVSGQFMQGKNGMFRGPPQLKNAYQFYNKTTICVDCFINADSQTIMQSIWIEPVGFSYTQHNFTQTQVETPFTLNGISYDQTSFVNENFAGLVVYHNRYVDGSCMSAEVVYENDTTIPATIKYLTSGCKDKHYLETSNTIIPDHPISYDNPYSSLHYKALVTTIKSSGGYGNCINEKCPALSIGNNFNNPLWNTKSK